MDQFAVILFEDVILLGYYLQRQTSMFFAILLNRGPYLVSSLKDSSLHSSLRQPAFNLFQTIIVSDAAVLVSSMLDCHTPPIISKRVE